MSTSTAKKIIALVGAPNSGKTTLYNWLTGSKFKTVNYPGATVEYSIGSMAARFGDDFLFMDTPGTYSLHPKSADEIVTLKALYNPEIDRPEGVIVVVDGTQLSRHLLLAQQIYETQFPRIVVVTMSDLLRKQGLQLDLQVLSAAFKCEVVLFDGLLGGGLQSLIDNLRKLDTTQTPHKPFLWDEKTQIEKNKQCDDTAQKALLKTAADRDKLKNIFARTEKIDRILLHPSWGLILFFLIMSVLFSSIYWLATPLMDLIDSSLSWIAQKIMELGPETLWADFLSHGLVASFSAVLVFVPQIFILFIGIGLLESSGYLARAATLVDRPFSRLGLSGRSFVPILSGFACAVPALMATRNIPSTRDRLITNFVIPLMNCSARLPVYALLLGFIFVDQSAWKAGLSLAALYMGALFVGFIAAAILHRMLPADKTSFFMLELPLYRRPRWNVILHQAVTRTKSFVGRAGPVIFVLAIVLWFGTNFPRSEAQDEQQKVEASYAGQLGHMLEPVFHPMGVDWRVGIGLVSAFAAREVFVSSMAVVFAAASDDEGTQQKNLLQTMSTAVNSRGEKIFTVSSVLGLIIFFMIALQCMSTVAMAYKESNSLMFATVQLVSFNLVAYGLAVGIVQGLRLLGVS